jgi:folate-binding protein YgfZ
MSLLDAQTLSIEGPDARAFAQAQFASDVSQLAPGQWQWSAWLDPRGRVRMLMQIMCLEENELLLLLRGGIASVLAGQLQRYVLRHHVTIRAHEPRQLIDAAGEQTGRIREDADGWVLDVGDYALRLGNDVPTTQKWRLDAIDHGHPWLPEALLDALLAPALSLTRLGAVRLDKGCYPGQEIIARLHYRGGLKQHLWRIASDVPLAPGDTLGSADKPAGQVLDCAPDGEGGYRALLVSRGMAAQPHAGVGAVNGSENIRVINAFQHT